MVRTARSPIVNVGESYTSRAVVGRGDFKKRAPRTGLRRPAVLIGSGGASMSVIILDISSGGFKIEITEPPRIGEFVTIRTAGEDEIPAQIRWVLGSEAGGVFLSEVDYSRLT